MEMNEQKKQSVLGILALICGILGILLSCAGIGIYPAIIGLILAIIGLAQKDKKHGIAIAGLVCSAVALVFSFFAVSLWDSIFGTDEEDTPGKTGEIVQESQVGEPEARKESSEVESSETEDSIEILAEYTLPDGIGWYTRHFMIIKNNSNKTIDVSTSSLAYMEDGTMAGAADSSFDALGAGCTSVLYEAFETEADISYYETDLEFAESRYYDSVLQDLSYVQNDIDEGAVFQVTNNGSDAAEFVEGYALFFLNDELVDYGSTYFTDDDSEIKPGATISEQMNSYEDFDRIEFYLTGRK